ncbi:MAG: hypothetical protein KIT13_12255 [Burkholderiales bacterium]|nr:hypothetical protein [Burkholderiales bacterium]MCW5576858.1 hypothetical protein [Burkholderiales bacterium]
MADRRRLLSGLIALYYLGLMWRHEGWAGAAALLAPLAVPLGLIWYAGTLSRSAALGWMRGRIDRPSPPAAIRALGWVLLLMPLAVIAVQRLRA